MTRDDLIAWRKSLYKTNRGMADYLGVSISFYEKMAADPKRVEPSSRRDIPRFIEARWKEWLLGLESNQRPID